MGVDVADVRALAHRLSENIERALVGKRTEVDLAVLALLCQGHLLIEDVPGTGKTTLARALADSVGGIFRRVQCTPDLLPGDVTGVSVFDQRSAEFVFRPGPVFANVLLVDEINRATPRTQSSVLEAMQEAQVTVEGTARPLPRPFVVLATQNPIEMEGTFPLPEAQLDRFLLRLSLGYPSEADEELMVLRDPAESRAPLEPVADVEEILAASARCAAVRVQDEVRRYLVQVCRATREDTDARLGASPRATLALHRASQTWAAMQGRDFVVPDDVQRVAQPVLAHRLVIDLDARLRGRDGRSIVETAFHRVPVEHVR